MENEGGVVRVLCPVWVGGGTKLRLGCFLLPFLYKLSGNDALFYTLFSRKRVLNRKEMCFYYPCFGTN